MRRTDFDCPSGTSLIATELGFGGAPLGNLFAALSEETAQATLGAAWDAGMRWFDTAPLYGLGLSEERVGRFLTGVPRGEVTVSTKAGRVHANLEQNTGIRVQATQSAVVDVSEPERAG